MQIKILKPNPTKGIVILNKGIREPGGHYFEIFVSEGIFFATIVHATIPMQETFEIMPKKFVVLESAVDARITELGW